MTLLELKSISKSFPGGVKAVDSFDLVVSEGDFIVLVGPSGCGKTTVLRMIAGLDETDEGTILLDGADISYVAPKERGVSMTFQDYALYPHLTVWENIAFPLRMARFSKARIKEMVEEIALSMQIKEVLGRRPSALSGGQRQRVAIARALVKKPKICLMDEPFSNLDAQLRVQMRGELVRIYKEHNMTIVFVTHDQTEAMALGARIVIMKEGVIQQAASSKELYHSPVNLFVASFFGTPPMNTYPAVLYLEDGVWSVRIGTDLEADSTDTSYMLALGQVHSTPLTAELSGVEVVLGIRPELINVVDDKKSSKSHFTAKIERVEEFGSYEYLYSTFLNSPLVVRTPLFAQTTAGAWLDFTFDPSDCYVFDKATGVNLLSDASLKQGQCR